MEEQVIVCKDAAVSFKGFQMQPIRLSIPQGYIVGIQGDNGAGKSTFLKMIAGQFPKMRGSILVNGIDVTANRTALLSQIAVVSEQNHFFEDESVQQNEKLLSAYYSNWNQEMFLHWLEVFHIAKGTKVKNLSKGERVKFQMAFAAAHTPKVILLDEPTAGLDPVAREEFLRLLQNFVAEYETTVLLATHLDEDINRIADYLIRIENGQCEMTELGEER